MTKQFKPVARLQPGIFYFVALMIAIANSSHVHGQIILQDTFTITPGAGHPLQNATISYTETISPWPQNWANWVGTANKVTTDATFTISGSSGYDGTYTPQFSSEMFVINESAGSPASFPSRVDGSGNAISDWTNGAGINSFTFALAYPTSIGTGDVTGQPVALSHFAGLQGQALVGGQMNHSGFSQFNLSAANTSGSSIAVPEPSSFLFLGLVAIVGYLWKKRSAG